MVLRSLEQFQQRISAHKRYLARDAPNPGAWPTTHGRNVPGSSPSMVPRSPPCVDLSKSPCWELIGGWAL